MIRRRARKDVPGHRTRRRTVVRASDGGAPVLPNNAFGVQGTGLVQCDAKVGTAGQRQTEREDGGGQTRQDG
jgi:hypothetical protein